MQLEILQWLVQENYYEKHIRVYQNHSLRICKYLGNLTVLILPMYQRGLQNLQEKKSKLLMLLGGFLIEE